MALKYFVLMMRFLQKPRLVLVLPVILLISAQTFAQDKKPDSINSEYSEAMVARDKALREAKIGFEQELQKLAEAEQLEYERRRVYDEQKKEHEIELEKVRKQTVELRFKQQKVSSELESLQNELLFLQQKRQVAKEEISFFKSKDDQEKKNFEVVKQQHEESKKSLSLSYSDLEKTRIAVNQKIFKSQMEMQQLRNDIASNEVAISRAENDKVRLLSEEVRVRTEWASLNAKSKELLESKRVILTQLSDLQKKLDWARKDYNVAKNENDAIISEVKKLSGQVEQKKLMAVAEMKNLENGIAAYRSKATENELEKDRLLALQEKVRIEYDDVKSRHEVARQAALDTSEVVMETRLSVEKSKGDLAREYAGLEKSKLKADTQKQIRNLASIVDSSDILTEQIIVQVNKSCNVRREPSSEAKVVGQLSPGQKIVVGGGDDKFYKMLNSSGKVQFVRKTCVDATPQ